MTQPIVFHAVSGCPYVWRVWLSLEHLKVPYELRMHSMDAGDLRRPEFLAMNPRGRAPVIADDGFVMYESTAVEQWWQSIFAALTPREPGTF